jgi:dipeptidase E
METIILSSSGKFLIEELDKYIDKPLESLKIAYITTASKKVDDLSYLNERRQKMTELGLQFEEIDLDGKNKEQLIKILENKDIIFIEGGNAFYLLKAIRESGFNEIIKDLLKKGVIYIGSSAGSYVACPTIEVATWGIGKNIFDRCGVTDLSALNLVPFILKCHYHHGMDEVLKEKSKETKHPLRILTDEQAFLIKGGDTKLVGSGEEVII